MPAQLRKAADALARSVAAERQLLGWVRHMQADVVSALGRDASIKPLSVQDTSGLGFTPREVVEALSGTKIALDDSAVTLSSDGVDARVAI